MEREERPVGARNAQWVIPLLVLIATWPAYMSVEAWTAQPRPSDGFLATLPSILLIAIGIVALGAMMFFIIGITRRVKHSKYE